MVCAQEVNYRRRASLPHDPSPSSVNLLLLILIGPLQFTLQTNIWRLKHVLAPLGQWEQVIALRYWGHLLSYWNACAELLFKFTCNLLWILTLGTLLAYFYHTLIDVRLPLEWIHVCHRCLRLVTDPFARPIEVCAICNILLVIDNPNVFIVTSFFFASSVKGGYELGHERVLTL